MTGGGNVTLQSKGNAEISALSVAAGIAVGITGGKAAIAFSGGGSVAENVIYSTNNAFIDNSNLGTTSEAVGGVDRHASSMSEITAVVPSVAVSVARGGKAGVGAAIGISVARNIIGAREDNIPYDYTTASTPDAIHTGDTVSHRWRSA